MFSCWRKMLSIFTRFKSAINLINWNSINWIILSHFKKQISNKIWAITIDSFEFAIIFISSCWWILKQKWKNNSKTVNINLKIISTYLLLFGFCWIIVWISSYLYLLISYFRCLIGSSTQFTLRYDVWIFNILGETKICK